ncbi:MAG: hypothetical protein J6B51_02435 [Clostridia bacterium]|nr:hypothetical protein [Clostridia bacterium]
MKIKSFSAEPVSLITKDGRQLVILNFKAEGTGHIDLKVYEEKSGELIDCQDVAVASGKYRKDILLTRAKEDMTVRWAICSKSGEELFTTVSFWKKPREWTFYVMLSSHVDIGLHEPQYFQRDLCLKTLDTATALCDETSDRPDETNYRYVAEGRWFWENYPMEKGSEKAESIVENYIKKGKIGVGAGLAGNHTNVYGLEEMCRSTYSRRKLKDKWDIESKTFCIADVNGLSWAMVEPYADAGYENIVFCPNNWNPITSSIWHFDLTKEGRYLSPNAGGAGARCDVRYDSDIPMLYWWESPSNGKRLLFWASTQYGFGGEEFGFTYQSQYTIEALYKMKKKFANRLTDMEERYPYDLWMLASYGDNELPNKRQLDLFTEWNKIWEYPKIRTIGNPDEPFNEVKKRFADCIPTIKGEMTGGWYQHPVAAPQLLADKLEIDRRLANAETFASFAALHCDHPYPAQNFSRAWEYLFYNDEHSYGTSGYQGRRVYETWLQHRDWLERAAETATKETDLAINTIVDNIELKNDSLVVFNPTARQRTERILHDNKSAEITIPPCGYKTVPLGSLTDIEAEEYACAEPPTVENSHYKIKFAENGSMISVYDKVIGKELLKNTDKGANCFIFTEDNHKSFVTPKKAEFTVRKTPRTVTVTVKTEEERSGAAIISTVTLDELHHRVEIDNDLTHIRAMINKRRYYRYIYFSFPFDVPNAKRICNLNGCEAEYAKDLTGHCTDTYMSAHEWALSENEDFGAALIQRDSLLVEYSEIHPDKTDYGAVGDGSEIFSYVSNDWLQMHETGGSHVYLHLRYAITSWNGSYEKYGLREMAEKFVNPVISTVSKAHGGKLPEDGRSFISVEDNRRLLCVKRAEDGDGVIARLYGEGEISADLDGLPTEKCTIDERPCENTEDKPRFATLRIKAGSLPRKEDTPDLIDENKPAPIGSVWTGLVAKPKAIRGERDGHLYILWARNGEKNLSHYELYRSKVSGFTPSEENFVAKIEPEEYCVGRYVDDGLEIHTEYFYRVRAVNRNGVCGDFSDEFSAFTKEPIPDEYA